MSAMDLIKSMVVAASGLKAQSGRMRIIAENIANADSAARVPGGDPYRRKMVTFENALNRDIGHQTSLSGKAGWAKIRESGPNSILTGSDQRPPILWVFQISAPMGWPLS